MTNVFHIVSDNVWTGTCQQVYDLASQLRNDDRFYIEIVCKKHDAVLRPFRRLEVPVSILPLKGLTDIDSPVRLANMLRTGRNVVVVHSLRDAATAILARRISENRNTKIIVTVHNAGKVRTNFVYNRIYRSIDRWVFVSQFAADFHAGKIRRLDPQRCTVIRDSVIPVTPGDDVPNLREELNIAPEKKIIMYHGRLCHDKGVDTLLRAVTQLDKSTYHLVLLGDSAPAFLTRAKGFIVANQLLRNVSLLGFKEHIQQYIAQCDIGVIPSVAPEAMGLSCLEYLMMGKPLVTTGNGAQREYVTHGENGMLVEPDNHFMLAQTLKRLIDDDSLRERIAVAGGETFTTALSYSRYYDAITTLYQS